MDGTVEVEGGLSSRGGAREVAPVGVRIAERLIGSIRVVNTHHPIAPATLATQCLHVEMECIWRTMMHENICLLVFGQTYQETGSQTDLPTHELI